MIIRLLVTGGLSCALLLGVSSCNSGENANDDGPEKKKERPVPEDPVVASDNHLLITEIVPHGEHAFNDEDGDASDWIELYNNSSEAISLGDFALTDDKKEPLKWRFPERSLESRTFVVVFASGKGRTEAGGNLHSNFKLDADGEYLALVRIEDQQAVHAFAPVFPEVPKGESYGYVFEDGEPNTDKLRFFDAPTPDASNSDPPAEPEGPESSG